MILREPAEVRSRRQQAAAEILRRLARPRPLLNPVDVDRLERRPEGDAGPGVEIEAPDLPAPEPADLPTVELIPRLEPIPHEDLRTDRIGRQRPRGRNRLGDGQALGEIQMPVTREQPHGPVAGPTDRAAVVQIGAPQEAVGRDVEPPGREIRLRDDFSEFGVEVRREKGPRDHGGLAAVKTLAGAATTEEKEAAVDAAQAAVVEPTASADAEAVAQPRPERPRPEQAPRPRLAEEPRLTERIRGRQDGDIRFVGPPEQILGLDE